MVVNPINWISFRGTSIFERGSLDQFPPDDRQDCFFVGPENHLVPTLIAQVITPVSETHLTSPLVLWGGRGTGKSLLARGLERRCCNLGQSVVFIDGEKDDYQSLQKKYDESGRDTLWIIDDLDQFSVTDSMVNFLCDFLDHGSVTDERIVVTMGVPPSALLHFPARLRSRFHVGIVLKLNPHPQTHESWLSDTIEPLGEKTITLSEICRVISKYFGIAVRDLKGRSRQRGIVLPRQVLMYLGHQLYGHSVQKIGKFLGRDHSTVSHGCQMIEKKLDEDLEIKKHLSLLKSAIEKRHQ